uniref:Uncharacterized protein n=1 Tax=Arundo donax TaxID=35708 RepID=A0A0A9H4V3_ARUDO
MHLVFIIRQYPHFPLNYFFAKSSCYLWIIVPHAHAFSNFCMFLHALQNW